MAYSLWQPGLTIASPAYLDAGFLISAFVRKDPRYQKSVTLVADLLVNQAEIVISALTVSETLWGLAKLSFCDLTNQPSRVAWNPDIYRKHCTAIFQTYGPRMNQIYDTLRDWLQAGVIVHTVPINTGGMQQASRIAPSYMNAFQMASADSLHLALAESQAKSLITTDSGFKRAASSSLQIVHIIA